MNSNTDSSTPTKPSGGLSALWKKEDYWAVWIGLGLVLTALLFWLAGSNFMKTIAVSFAGN